MRGLLSLLIRGRDSSDYRTGVFVASAEPDIIAKVLPEIRRRFPQVSFSFLASQAYAELFPWMREVFGKQEVLWIEQVKANPVRGLVALRKRQFDLCMMLWSGRPTFRVTKLAAFSLNARRFIVYNEDGDSLLLDRTNWKYIIAHVSARVRRWRPKSLFPFGFFYLLGRTLWLRTRGRFLARRAESERGAQVRTI
jgi:hypothetical protein